MIIDKHHPDFYKAKVVDQDGNGMTSESIQSVDLIRNEYTRTHADRIGIEIVKVKKITWDWYTKTITIDKSDP